MKANLWAMVTASRALLAVTAVVFVGASCVVGTGCGKSDAQMAGDTARTFMSALANDDKMLARAQMTRLAREKMADADSASDKSGGMGKDGYTVGEATIDGDSASVPVTVTEANDGTGGEGESEAAPPAPTVTEIGSDNASKETRSSTQTIVLKMRREEGQWKVWAMRVPLAPGGPNITMDFEHPEAILGEAFKGIGEGIGAAMKGLGEGMVAMFQGMAKGMAEGAKAAEKGAKAANEITEKTAASTEQGVEKNTEK